MIYWVIVIILLLIIVIFSPTNQTENFSSDVAQEAVLNISSVYNKDNLQITNINATGKITADNIITNTLNPTSWKGMIVAFSGDTPPEGWIFCDGKNGTPDLRDKFVLGKSDSSKIGDTGGEKTHMLTVDEMPAHTHDTIESDYNRHCGDSSGCAGGAAQRQSTSTGGGKPHNNMPPYFVLAYIMKL